MIPIYFRLAVPEGSLSVAEMRAALALTSDAKAFGTQLIAFAHQLRPDKTTRVRAFLERLEDYTAQDIPQAHIPFVIQALLDVGDQLLRPEDDRRGFFEFRNDIRIGRIIWQLLRRLDQSQRFIVLREAMAKGRAVGTIVHEVAVLGQEHGKHSQRQPPPEEARVVNVAHLTDLEHLALTKIQTAAQDGLLLATPSLPSILYRWRDWGGEKEVKEWVDAIIRKDQGLLTFLEAFLQKGMSHSMDDRAGRITYRLDPQFLEPFLTPAEIVDRAQNLSASSHLTDNQTKAIEQFLREYELRQEGKDPNNPFSSMV
jgi:predicted KAP-like P-loop ATPase